MNEPVKLTTAELDRLAELVDALEKAKSDKKETETIKEKLMIFFRENHIKTFHHGNIVIRFTDERTTNEFDVDLLQEKYPEIWKECHCEHVREPHISIKKKVIKEESGEPSFEELSDEEKSALMSEKMS